MHLHAINTVHQHRTLVALYGEADLKTAPLMRQALHNATLHAEGRDVVADLCGVSFIDSSGAQPLLETDRRLHLYGKRLWLACLPLRTRRMLHAVRLAGYFPVLPQDIPIPTTCRPTHELDSGARHPFRWASRPAGGPSDGAWAGHP
ncbi:STAS domain-containing protein [Streptomyces sp. NPDC006879]|uniref:STAS domain-containing protein n=1 Tax=Streptomyces sp. NPDC006879 TaxID=3364767 RepID=UPI0036A50DD6